MKYKHSVFSLLVLMVVVDLTACGGGEQAADSTDGGKADTPDATAEMVVDTSAESQADIAFAIYKDALMGTMDAMSGDPQPEDAEVIEKVTSIRDEFAPKLVEIGKLREKMGKDWGMQFDMALMRNMQQKEFMDLQQEYVELQSRYGSTEAGGITAAMNIFTEYANFELLRKQKPEEAEKYGVMEEDSSETEDQ